MDKALYLHFHSLAFGIHTVTAWLYCGLPGRGFWLTAILAPRFLASAFAAVPAFLILLTFILRKVTKFDPGKEAIQMLAKIITYALIANVFFFICEVFVAVYSGIPEHIDHLQYLFFGLHGHGVPVPFMWTAMALMLIAIVLLVNPRTREDEPTLAVACVMLFVGAWIDKGMGLIAGGFVPNPLHHVNEYMPTIPEIVIFFCVGVNCQPDPLLIALIAYGRPYFIALQVSRLFFITHIDLFRNRFIFFY